MSVIFSSLGPNKNARAVPNDPLPMMAAEEKENGLDSADIAIWNRNQDFFENRFSVPARKR